VRNGRGQQTTAGANVLHVIARLKPVPDAMSAVVGYVKTAVHFVDDDIDLPCRPTASPHG
jgi:hypothetical protein